MNGGAWGSAKGMLGGGSGMPETRRQRAVTAIEGELACLCDNLRLHQVRLRAHHRAANDRASDAATVPPSPCLLDATTLQPVPELAAQLGLPERAVYRALVEALDSADSEGAVDDMLAEL